MICDRAVGIAVRFLVSSVLYFLYFAFGYADTLVLAALYLLLQLETDLRADPQDLDALKFVLNTIADISEMGMDIELSYLDTMERYRTLQQYDIPVPPDEMAKAKGIAHRWQALFIEAKTKDLCLVRVKERFREVTKEQALDFHTQLKEMEATFKATGPGNSNTELEDGVLLLAEYQRRVQVTPNITGSFLTPRWLFNLRKQSAVKKVNLMLPLCCPLCACDTSAPSHQACMARKLELVNAEGLFGLDTTDYPELQRVVSEMKKLGRIYDLYQEQRDFEDGNSATPWGDLDVASLQRGVEVLEKKARKEKQFKDHPTFRAVEARIFNFKNSIPLIVNLKNDAMKPRHWQKLIEVSDDTQQFALLLQAAAVQVNKEFDSIVKIDVHRWTHTQATQATLTLHVVPLVHVPSSSSSSVYYKYKYCPVAPPTFVLQMTGVKFDPSNFKALTLGNIFEMELHRFTADIDDIVNESVQELKIENEIRKVEATWRKTDLILAKYQKNGVDRSYVLKAADDIKTELEDNLLNLQTMSSSRFVGSFADQVRRELTTY